MTLNSPNLCLPDDLEPVQTFSGACWWWGWRTHRPTEPLWTNSDPPCLMLGLDLLYNRHKGWLKVWPLDEMSFSLIFLLKADSYNVYLERVNSKTFLREATSCKLCDSFLTPNSFIRKNHRNFIKQNCWEDQIRTTI